MWSVYTQVCIHRYPRALDTAAALLCKEDLETLPTVWLPGAGAQFGAGFRIQLLISAFHAFIRPSPEISLGKESLLHLQRNARNAKLWVFS